MRQLQYRDTASVAFSFSGQIICQRNNSRRQSLAKARAILLTAPLHFQMLVSSLAIGLKDELPRKAHPRTYDGV